MRYAIITAISLVITVGHAHGAGAWLENEANENLTRDHQYDCENTVGPIREMTRDRIAVDKFSIEQIKGRTRIDIGSDFVKCEGNAVLSNGATQSISYEAYIDSEGDWMVSYSLGNER